MGKIINPHIQWEYMTVSIRNPNDIANELNHWGALRLGVLRLWNREYINSMECHMLALFFFE